MTDQNWNYFYYQYDEVGNTTVDNKGTYIYDLNNNMISSSRTYTVNGSQITSTGNYVFNGLGHRVKKSVSGQNRYFVYNENNQLIGEYDNNGNVIAEYVYFGLRPVAVKNGSNINIVHTDYLTTPRIVTSGGSIVWQWRNDNPYGNNLAQGNIEFNLRFAGQYFDAESGLHYNIHRTYNPEIGRYMQSDPLGLSAGSNTYNYVGRNPFDAVDPLGLKKYNFNDSTAANSEAINQSYQNDYSPENYIETYGHAYSYGLLGGSGIIVGLNSPAMLELKTIDENLYNTLSKYKRCTNKLCSSSSIEIDGFAFAKILKTLNKGQKEPEKIIMHQCQVANVSEINMIKNEFPNSTIYASPYLNYMGYYKNNPYGASNKTYSLGSWTGGEEINDMSPSQVIKDSKFLPGYSGFEILQRGK